METQKRKPTNKAERRARELADLAATSGWDRKVPPHIARKAEEAAARSQALEDYRAGRRGGLDAVSDGSLSDEPLSIAQLAETLSLRRARLPVDVKPTKAMVHGLHENLRPFAAAVPPASDDDDDDDDAGSDLLGGEDDGVLGRDEDETDDVTATDESTTDDDDDDDDDDEDEQTGATAAAAAQLAGRKVTRHKTAHDVRVEEEKAKDFFDSLGVADKEMLTRSTLNVLLGGKKAKLERRDGVLVRRSTGKRFGEMPTRENRLSLAATPSQKEQTRYESELWDFFNRCLTELKPGARKGLLEELQAADEERSRKHNRVGPLKNPFGEVDDDDEATKLDLWRPVGWRSGADLARERAAQRLAREKVQQPQQKQAGATGRPGLTVAQVAQQQRTSGVLGDLLNSAAAAAAKKKE
jgi:hypothetical protein